MNSHQRRVARRRRDRESISLSDIVTIIPGELVAYGPIGRDTLLMDFEGIEARMWAHRSRWQLPMPEMTEIATLQAATEFFGPTDAVGPQVATGAALDELYKIPLRPYDLVRDCCPTFDTEPHDPGCPLA